MAIDSKYYLHKTDVAAFKALESIPGFSKLMKAYISFMYERQHRIVNMSSNVKTGPDQLSHYYEMLPPICEKLGIEVPELYIDMTPTVNASTFGDTKPFIVLNTGLIDAVPDHLIPTVLAHECGHIACHHTLYTSMASVILSGSSAFLNNSLLGTAISLPLQVAFYYWMRCSELSADRAAMIVDGGADKTIELCMILAGYRKSIDEKANVEAFINQAKDYREMINDSRWNKTFEYLLLIDSDHPLCAVRALEAQEWERTDCFKKILSGEFESEIETERPNKPLNLEMSLKIQGLKTDLKYGLISQEEYATAIKELLK